MDRDRRTEGGPRSSGRRPEPNRREDDRRPVDRRRDGDRDRQQRGPKRYSDEDRINQGTKAMLKSTGIAAAGGLVIGLIMDLALEGSIGEYFLTVMVVGAVVGFIIGAGQAKGESY